MYFSLSRSVISRSGTFRSVVMMLARMGNTGLTDGAAVVGGNDGSAVVGTGVGGSTGADVCPMNGLPVGRPNPGAAVVGVSVGLG